MLQNYQLVGVQRCPQVPRVADDLAGQRHAVVRPSQWSAWTPADLFLCCHPVLPEHQMPVRLGTLSKPWLGAKPVAYDGPGLEGKVPDFTTVSRRQHHGTGLAGGQHGDQFPERRRLETQEAWGRVSAPVAQGAPGH